MKWGDKPIIEDLSMTDFYKFPMGQFVFHRYPDVKVLFSLINRTKSAKLGKIIDIGELRENLDHVRTLSFGNSFLHYLRGTNEYESRMFEEDFLEFLRTFRLPEYNLEPAPDDQIRFDTLDVWKKSTHWEIYAMKIIKTLYIRHFMKDMTKFEREMMYAEGVRRLGEKIKFLKINPGILWSEFATRRSDTEWQEYVVRTLANEFPKNSDGKSQFLGTSNVYLAQKYDLMPMGTNAHELQMVISGLFSYSKEMFIQSIKYFLTEWWEEYGQGLAMFLPDTFGSEFMMSLITKEQAQDWKGMRQDSGDPIIFGENLIKFYEERGIDPKSKLLLFSDGLEMDTIKMLHERFAGRIRDSYGWGTNLADDFGAYPPLSIIVKAMEANGIGLVKLSDNIAKALGKSEDVERIKNYVGYTNNFSQTAKY